MILPILIAFLSVLLWSVFLFERTWLYYLPILNEIDGGMLIFHTRAHIL